MSGSLTDEQINAFERDGYLVLRGLLDPIADLEPIMEEYEGVLDRLATQMVAAGELADSYSHLSFSDRLIAVSEDVGVDLTQHFDFTLPRVTTRDTPIWTGPEVFSLLRHDLILDAIESLIGGEIYANPVQHVRLKIPEHRMPCDPYTGELRNDATPWHQDNGVVNAEADETETITVWLPLRSATHENGCLIVHPAAHHRGLLPHCASTTPVGTREGGLGLRIPSSMIGSETVELEMSAGDVLLMHRLTPHSSGHNASNDVRWSFDLRYQPVGEPTGRSHLPGFVARSMMSPETELRDHDTWARSWWDTRLQLAAELPASFNRWDDDAIACA